MGRAARKARAGEGDGQQARGLEPSDGSTRRFARPCMVKLTDAEIRRRLDQRRELREKKETAERELKEVSDEYKSNIGKLSAEMLALDRVLDAQAEERDVECEERFNYDNHMVEIVRLDTNEVVPEYSRAMTERERQPSLLGVATSV